LTIDRSVTSGTSFASIAGKFGQTAKELGSEIEASCAAIARFRESLDEDTRKRFEVRCYNTTDQAAVPGYLIPYRSYHRYSSTSSTRLDVMVPYSSSHDGFDTPLRPALIATEDSHCDDRDRATSAFDRIWSKAEVLK
jgi:hypothetical protein